MIYLISGWLIKLLIIWYIDLFAVYYYLLHNNVII